MTDREVLDIVLQKRPLLDVRAPIEFAHGSIPGATNLFLLNDDERAQVGTVYKRRGSDAAVALGHQILSGAVREKRIASWVEFARANPDAVIYCFRGGMRSQSVRRALQEAGIDLPLIPGGYKRVRHLFIEEISRACREEEFRIVSGFTGSGKTELLEAVTNQVRVCNLEKLSNHKGSAFGSAFGSLQPSQADFENRLAAGFLEGQGPIYTEDESRMIGRTVLPMDLHEKIKTSKVYLVERPLEERTKFLTYSYLSDNFGLYDGSFDEVQIGAAVDQMKLSLQGILKRLGGSEFAHLTSMVEDAAKEHLRTGLLSSHFAWVARLLERYYDPMYAYHLERLRSRLVFSGTWDEVREHIVSPSRP